jgi:putative ABC transport system substrate-binding protein
MRELGYVEGKDVVFEIRYAEGRSERLPELFAELINLKVDLLLTGSVLGALAAKKATTTVPIVFAGLGDALSSGIVPSLARPGGNITGARTAWPGGYDRKQLELLKEVVPGLRLLRCSPIQRSRRASKPFGKFTVRRGP